MSLTSAATGVAGNAANSAVDSAIQGAFNAKAANKAWDRQKDAWTKGPGYARQGLEAAGFNPLLASGIGSSVMGARGVTQAPVGRGSDFAGQTAKLSKLNPEKELINKQIGATQSAANASDASARAADATAAKTKTENDLARTALPAALMRQAADTSPLGRQAITRAQLNGLAAAASPTVESVLGTTTLMGEAAVENTIKAITDYFEKREKQPNYPTFKDKHNLPPLNVQPRTK